MEVHSYFPTFVLKEIDLPLAALVAPVVDRYLAMSDAEMYNIVGHRSTYQEGELNKALNSEPEIVEFKRIVTNIGKNFLRHRGYDDDAIPFNPFVFVNQIKRNAFFHRHAHPNSVLSGVFYVDASPDNAGLIIHDPRPYKMFIERPIKDAIFNNAPEIALTVNKGMLLMWDSWLEHEVPQNHSSLPRKTLVFNL